MRHLTTNTEVLFVPQEGANKKGVITEVITQGAARIDLTPRNDKGEAADPDKAPLGTHTALASYSSKGEPGSFHFADEAKAVAEAKKTEPPKPPTGAAAPASK